MSSFLTGIASRTSSVMKAVALGGLGVETGEELGGWDVIWAERRRNGRGGCLVRPRRGNAYPIHRYL